MKKLFLITAACLMGVCSATAQFVDHAASKPQVAQAVTATRHATLPQAQPAVMAQQQATATGIRRAPAQKAVTAADVPAQALQLDYTSGAKFSKARYVTTSLSGTKLAIKNFSGYGLTVTADVDLSTGAITIPRQAAYVSSTYGPCDIVHLNPSLTSYDTTATIAGQIADGEVSIGPWALYITTGQYKGYILNGAIESSTLQAVNATMNVTEIDTAGASHSYAYPVIAEQTAKNKVSVTNYAGLGLKVDIDIKADSSLAIYPQLLLSIDGTGNFWLRPYDPATNIIDGRNPIKGTTAGNKLAWAHSIVATNSGTYLARYASSDIALPFTLQYPAAATQAGWKGSGTEADPWLIETPADLIALSDSVNFAAPINVNVGARTGGIARAYEGKFFKVAKNINMTGIQFNPIGGSDERYRFGGTFDGGNRTISNLTVSVGTGDNAGLFGAADTTSVIKNVKLSNPKITNTYYYTGSVVGYSQGTVENCTVTNPVINGRWVAGGVAGLAHKASKLTVTRGSIVGETEVGGVVGVTREDASNLSATNVTVTCTSTTTTSSAGGVVGFYGGSGKSTTLSDCYFSGNVIATKNGEYIGGIAGVNTEGTIERCFAVAQIASVSTSYGQGAYGGIVGGSQAGTVKDCLFTGEVLPGCPNTGSIVGSVVIMHVDSLHADHMTLQNCLVSGINATTTGDKWTPYVGSFATRSSYKWADEPIVVNNCFYDEQIMPTLKVKVGPRKTTELTSAAGIEGFSTDVWTFTEGQYPALKNFATTTVSKVASAAIQLADTVQNVSSITADFKGNAASGITWYLNNGGKNGVEGHALLIQNKNEYHLNGSIGVDTVVIYNSSAMRYIPVKVAPSSLFEGKGTADEPYLIRNKQDLMTLSNATYTNLMPYDGTYFLITNDIDLEQDEAFNGISPNGSGSTSRMYGFGGILDGGGHTIHGIKMIKCQEVDGKLVGNTSSSAASGFVNTLKPIGIVKNLRIGKDCEFEFYSRSGAVVGYNFGGQILNCRNYADVKAHSGTVGGITSQNSTGGIIRDCYNSGRIWASYMYAAGIAPTNYGLIENCQNTGEVLVKCFNKKYATSKSNSAGGISEAIISTGQIRNCLNTGYVHAPKYVGGILAWFNGTNGDTAIVNSISTGQVSYNQVYSTSNVYLDTTLTDATIGNVVGKLYKTNVNFVGNYYDAQQNIYNACHNKSVEGINGVNTSVLTSGKPLPGFDTAFWQFTAGQYPMLKAFADEPGAIAGAHSVVWFDGSARCDSIKRDSRLGTAQGLTWTLQNGKNAFTLVDGTLSMDPAPVLADTLTATCNGFVKKYILTAVPDTMPAPVINVDGSTVTFTDAIPGATYFFTTDGSVPTRQSASTTGEADLPAGQLKIVAIASKHNYYDSPTSELDVTISGINDVATDADVISRYYVTPDGRTSAAPVQGINIVVTRHADGSTTVQKALMK